MKLLLVGAGGHARGVVEAACAKGHEIAAYVDPRASTWCQAPQLSEDAGVPPGIEGFIIGLGGVAPDGLRRRMQLIGSYLSRGLTAPTVCHPSSHVSRDAELAEAAIILAGAVVQPGARIGRGAIINTAAVVEHGSTVGEGAHVAPGTIVLGDVSIGALAMVGAGAVMLPGTKLPAEGVVKSLARFNGGEVR